MKVCFQKPFALTPALSHLMGEGESFAVSFEFVSAGIARRVFANNRVFACCSPLPSDGRGVRGEGQEAHP